MPCITYVRKNFGPKALEIIDKAREICEEYRRQGYDLTLRQLYYQFVARGLITNKQSEYSRLGGIINDARLAGLLDWSFIVDRTRNLRSISHWDTPADVIRSASYSWAIDRWADQPTRVEVWIEKDALVGVLASVCPDEDVPYFSCRGYTSQSEVWGAAQRIGGYLRKGQDVEIIHLGDHDPSGVDMTRDIEDRLRLFTSSDNTRWAGFRPFVPIGRLSVNRIALNMNQIEQYNPPPNPAKLTDSRARGYIEEHGSESWELDALDPSVLSQLVRDAINENRDPVLWAAATARQEDSRVLLQTAASRWNDVEGFLTEEGS